jgi:hypothetical protein
MVLVSGGDRDTVYMKTAADLPLRTATIPRQAPALTTRAPSLNSSTDLLGRVITGTGEAGTQSRHLTPGIYIDTKNKEKHILKR